MMKNLFAAIAALFMIGSASAQVTVTGTGTVKAKPDIAHVTLAVVSDAKTAADATALNSDAMSKLCDTIEKCKVGKKDIKTTGFNLQPVYDYPEKGSAKLSGYVVNNYLSVTVRDLAILGKLLDKAITSGANRVEGVTWDIADKADIFTQTRKNALADALGKAKLYAEGGSFKLGKVKSIEDHSYNSRNTSDGPYMRTGQGESRPTIVPTNPGEIEFRISIAVVWNIE